MKIVIAEKPSVAQSLAKVLGASKRRDGYLEGNGYLVSWCVGHLMELSEPDVYDKRYGKWRYEDLPILPKEWKYEVFSGTKKQFDVLKTLMNQDDVTDVINSCDAGREGELIFRLVYQESGCRKPVERLWISSMEDKAIREGFEHLRPETEYDALYEAALCRERADWIVGINATRLFSCLYGQTLNVGRVMTPTLGMVVMRDAEIRAFKPTPFFTVQLQTGGFTAISQRFEKREEAQGLHTRCREDAAAVVKSVERKEKTEHPPLLYDLTTLQRDANKILGYTAQQTLDYTQSLYEKKLVTYPRTDSQYLPDEMQEKLSDLVEGSAIKLGFSEADILQPKRVINSQKVSDHHAIIPTETSMQEDTKDLPAGEQEILKLVRMRLICAVGADHRYAETKVILTCGGEEFTAKSKEILQEGWKGTWQQVYPAKEKEKQEEINAYLEAGDTVNPENIEVKEGKTSNQKHFTEDTLLSAMQAAGKEDMPEDAERTGIGTPATRAGIIEKLVQKGFLERKGDRKSKYLTATEKGNALITVMPEQIQSPSMTAEWEQKLLEIEHGEYSPEAFMEEIEGMITSLVATYEKVKGADTLMARNKVIGICPHCGSEVLEKQKGWFCSNRDCRFALWKDNAYFNKIGKRITPAIVEQLLKDGKAPLKGCKSQKTGKTYDANVILTTAEDGRPSFSLEIPNKKRQSGQK